MNNYSTKNLQVGSRIYYTGDVCNAGSGGIVVAIHGEPTGREPETIGGGVGVAIMGDSAMFDIVLDDGRRRDRVREEAFFGIGHRFEIDGAVDKGQAAQMVAKADAKAAQDKAARNAANAEFEEQCAVLSAQYPELTRVADDHNAAQKNIRKLLRLHFPGVKFSVRSARGVDSIRVNTDAELTADQRKAARDVCGWFELGSFDGMFDSYNWTRTPWTTVFGGAQYVTF